MQKKKRTKIIHFFFEKVRFFNDFSRKVYQEYFLINMRFFQNLKMMMKEPKKYEIAILTVILRAFFKKKTHQNY